MPSSSHPEPSTSSAAMLGHLGHSLQRRQVLLSVSGIAALLAARQWLPTAIAQTPGSQEVAAAPSAEVMAFLNFSRKLTAHNELSPVTARRILEAGNRLSATFAPQVAELVKLTNDAADSPALMAAAELAGLKDHALAINTVWYTGTVVGPKASQVVAYREALMYSAVQDALPVPTYCLNGPLWWTQKPPAV